MRLHLDYITFAILVTLEYIFCFEQSGRSLCSTPWSLSALIYWHRLEHHCVPHHGHCLHWFIDKAWYITVSHFMVTVCTDLLTKPGTSLCSTSWSLSALIYWQSLVHHCGPLHGHCLHWFIDKAWYMTVFHFMVTVCTDLLTKPGTSLCSTSWSLSALIYWQSLVHHCSTSWSLSALIYWQSLVHHCVPLHGHCLHWFIDKAWYITVFHFMVTVCTDLLTKPGTWLCSTSWSPSALIYWQSRPGTSLCSTSWSPSALIYWQSKPGTSLCSTSWSPSALIYWQSRPGTSLCSTHGHCLRWSIDKAGLTHHCVPLHGHCLRWSIDKAGLAHHCVPLHGHCLRWSSVVRSAGTSGGPSKKKKHPLPARSNAASSLEESRQRYKVGTFGSSGPRTDSGLCRGLKSLQVVPEVGFFSQFFLPFFRDQSVILWFFDCDYCNNLFVDGEGGYT